MRVFLGPDKKNKKAVDNTSNSSNTNNNGDKQQQQQQQVNHCNSADSDANYNYSGNKYKYSRGDSGSGSSGNSHVDSDCKLPAKKHPPLDSFIDASASDHQQQVQQKQEQKQQEEEEPRQKKLKSNTHTREFAPAAFELLGPNTADSSLKPVTMGGGGRMNHTNHASSNNENNADGFAFKISGGIEENDDERQRQNDAAAAGNSSSRNGGDGRNDESQRNGGEGRNYTLQANNDDNNNNNDDDPLIASASSSSLMQSSSSASASRRRKGIDIEDALLRVNHRGPRAAVAAAATSPHRSTLNNTTTTARRRNDHSKPEDDDEWQDNDSKQYSQSIFLGKSNNEADRSGREDGSGQRAQHQAKRNYKSSCSSSSTLSAGPTPLLNGPIPGSMGDPATMSKTNRRDDTMDQQRIYVDGDINGMTDDLADAVISKFIHLLRTKHNPPLDMVEMDGDGNCLFRAISLQVYGDPSMHLEVRRNCMDFMEREVDHFRNFVADEEFEEYIARKRLEGVHGNHNEIQAMSELYNRSIEVYVPNHGIEPINIFHSEYKSDDAPIRLCYMDGNHYNAVIDPLVPTAGLGLGLPGLQPGLADKLQLEEAKKISDESAMEEKIAKLEEIEVKEALKKSSLELAASGDDIAKKKAMYLSEIEAADFDLEQAVLASSLESYQQAEQERKPSSSRRGDGRRSRFNSSPRSLRSSSNSPVYRSNAAAAASSSSSNPYATAAAASASSTASASATGAAMSAGVANSSSNLSNAATDEYPPSVQELVMNGFELSKVLHAYDLVGDNFDDLLSFLLSCTT